MKDKKQNGDYKPEEVLIVSFIYIYVYTSYKNKKATHYPVLLLSNCFMFIYPATGWQGGC